MSFFPLGKAVVVLVVQCYCSSRGRERERDAYVPSFSSASLTFFPPPALPEKCSSRRLRLHWLPSPPESGKFLLLLPSFSLLAWQSSWRD